MIDPGSLRTEDLLDEIHRQLSKPAANMPRLKI